MGATVGVQGEACILGSAYRLHTDTTAFVGTFFINLGEGGGGQKGEDYTNTQTTRTLGDAWGKKGVAARGLRNCRL